MELSFIGVVIKVLDKRSGVSAKTGQTWATQSYVVQTEEQFPKRLLFDVFGEDKINQFAIRERETIRVTFETDAREYEGKWFGSNRAYRVEKLVNTNGQGVAQQAPAAQPAAPQYAAPAPPQQAPAQPAQPYAAPAPQYAQPAAQPAPQQGNQQNDLPF